MLAVVLSLTAIFTVLVFAKPKLWLPVYLVMMPIAPQVAIGNIPLSPTEPVLAAAILSMFCNKLFRRDFKVAWAPLFLPTGLFVIMLFFSSLNAWALWGPKMGLISMMKFIRIAEAFAAMYLAAELWRSADDKNTGKLLKWILIGVIGAAVLGLISIWKIDWFFTLYKAEDNYGFQIWVPGLVIWRAIGVFLDPNHLSSYLSMGILLALVLSVKSKIPVNRFLIIGTLVIGSIALLLTFSRAGWLSLFISTIVYISISKDLKRTRKIQILSSIGSFIVLGIAVIYLAFPDMSLGLLNRVVDTFDQASAGDWNAVTSTRLSVWQTGIKEFYKYPIFGIGYKCLPELFLMGDNNYLTMLAECGLIGAGIWAVWLLSVSVYLYNLAKRHWIGEYILAVWVGLVINMATADIMTYWRTLPLFFGLLGVSFAFARKPEISSAEPAETL
ncbi:MAG: O-antigen ligase family protein [Armatimonadota bacterium]